MVKAAPETILLKGEPTRKERDAGGSITPGHLLQLDADNDVVVHASAEGLVGARWFAFENDIAGDDIDHVYLITEVVQIHSAKPGDEINTILADNNTITIGDFLVSAGNGQVQEISGESGAVVAGALVGMALEAVTTSGAVARLKIEVI